MLYLPAIKVFALCNGISYLLKGNDHMGLFSAIIWNFKRVPRSRYPTKAGRIRTGGRTVYVPEIHKGKINI